MKHPFDEILEASLAEAGKPIDRRSALNAVLATGLGIAGLSSLQAELQTTQALGEEGGDGRKGKSVPPEASLSLQPLHVSYLQFDEMQKGYGNKKIGLGFQSELEKLAIYEVGRCRRQLEDARLGQLEPLATLLTIVRMERLRAAAEAKELVMRYRNRPDYQKAAFIAKERMEPKPTEETKEEPPAQRRDRGINTSAALGEEG